MNLDLRTMTEAALDDGRASFEENGYLRLSGVSAPIIHGFRHILSDIVGIPDDGDAIEDLLAPDREAVIFPREIRQRLSRISTPRDFAVTLIGELRPLLQAMVGPLMHVSSTFHAQFKGGVSEAIDHYHNEGAADFMEVHGAYNLHQDFTGASLPTSPSAVTLWVPLNTCSQWTLRLYPGTHRLGLFCHRFVKPDDPRLASFAPPVDVSAEAGTAVLFNALLLHGTSNAGSKRRVSCDLRFFPLCGFLPSEVHVTDPDSVGRLHDAARRAPGPVLRAPALEALTLLGESVEVEDPPALSSLNWVKYLAHLADGGPEEGLPYLRAFINTQLLDGPAAALIDKFHGRPLLHDNLGAVRERVHGVPPDTRAVRVQAVSDVSR
jgi:hypothetical protein